MIYSIQAAQKTVLAKTETYLYFSFRIRHSALTSRNFLLLLLASLKTKQ